MTSPHLLNTLNNFVTILISRDTKTKKKSMIALLRRYKNEEKFSVNLIKVKSYRVINAIEIYILLAQRKGA